MDDRVDDDLRALKAEPTPAAYDLIEPRVWRGIAALRQARQGAPVVYAVRAAASADFARAAGKGVEATRFVVGVRTWF